MSYITIVILFAIQLFAYKIKGNVFNPATIFSSVWLLETVCTSFGLYAMNEVSNKAYLMVALGNICFFAGCLPRAKRSVKFKNSGRVHDEAINKTTYMISVAIALVSVLVVLVAVRRFMKQGYSYTNIRNMLFGYATNEQLVDNGLFMVFFSWVVVGLIQAIIPVSIIWVFERKQKTKLVTPFVGLITIVLYALATGGRNMFLVLGADIIVMCLYHKLHIPKKVKRVIAVIGAASIAFLVYLTIQRRGDSERINSVYAYAAVTIPLLDYWTDYIGQNGLFTWGLSLIYGALAVAQWAFHVFDIELPMYTFVNSIINMPQNEWIVIFHKPTQQYNAFVSTFFTFYTDFGWVGVTVFSFLFGYLLNRTYTGLMKTRSKKQLALYLFEVQMMILSFLRFGLSNPSYIVTLFAIPFFFKKKWFSVKRSNTR